MTYTSALICEIVGNNEEIALTIHKVDLSEKDMNLLVEYISIEITGQLQDTLLNLDGFLNDLGETTTVGTKWNWKKADDWQESCGYKPKTVIYLEPKTHRTDLKIKDSSQHALPHFPAKQLVAEIPVPNNDIENLHMDKAFIMNVAKKVTENLNF